MNYFDITILTIILIFIFVGWRKGLLAEVVGLIGIAAALVMAVRFGPDAGRVFARRFHLPELLAVFAGFALVFGGVWMFFHIFKSALEKVLSPMAIKWLDKLGGLLLGVVEGVVVASILIFLFSLTPLAPAVEQDIERSQLYHPTERVAPALFDAARRMFPIERTFAQLKGTMVERIERTGATSVVEQAKQPFQSAPSPAKKRPTRSTSSGGGERGRP
ncbi:MAG: CvpA family protein [bacterium]|jgi:membrane protein required for colicin V production|nr:CvpA family protein [candidate division KSB1 bacterium]MDH7560797.1 CvpA family protein [bacterium]